MNADQRFYCPQCLIPVEYSEELNIYMCGGTCNSESYLVSELITGQQIMDVRILARGNEDES